MASEQMIESRVAALSPATRELLQARLRGLSRTASVIPHEPRDQAPTSFGQERLWFLDRVGQGGAAYNIAVPLRVSGAFDVGAFERALSAVVERHDALRTTFREIDGVLVQIITPFDGFTLRDVDLSALAESDREAEGRRLATEERTRPFDLSAGALVRATLVRLAPEEHLLLLCMHHIVSDGWSMGVFFRELWAGYDAYRAGAAPRLPELALQYADFAVWQRVQLQGKLLEGHLEYWKDRLAGAPDLLALPTDRPRPPVASGRGSAVPVAVPVDLLDDLRALARREGATLFMVVLAAFQALLARYCGSDDVVIGTLVAGRSRSELQPLIGLFMNTLVLRTDLSGDPTVREAIARARDTVLGAYEHQDLPFEQVVAEIRPERNQSYATLFQVLFQLETEQRRGSVSDGLHIRGVHLPRQSAKFDLTLDLAARADGIGGVLEYSTDLFDHDTARRIVAHLTRLLEQMAADPATRLSAIDLLTAAERTEVVETWNATTAPYPADRCIHELFAAQAARTPAAIAVRYGAASLTYAALDAQANQLAHVLRGYGVGPEVRVGLCVERGLELLVALFGVLKAGGAYVPLDPSHPRERQAYMLADAGVRVVVTQTHLAAALPVPAGIPVVAVDDATRWAAAPTTVPVSGVTADHLCYVIYTSGSTGRPKGVAMHHRGVSNYLDWGGRAYGAAEGQGAPLFTSLAVDLTVTNLLPLFAGQAVHVLPEAQPVEALAAVLRQQPGFGLIKITPVHLSLLTPLLTAAEAAGTTATLVVGADFLSAETTVFWQDAAPGVRLLNEYGPTETVVGCSAYALSPGRHRTGPVPVGGPIQNLQFYVLDAAQQPVPVGVAGELYIGGVGVARGYLGQPGLTAARFVPDPFTGGGARLYRTGDRARWLAGGTLLILGRTDDQVKIRGYRVELGEVAAVLRQAAGVTACRVIVREDRPGDRRLVAYVVGAIARDALLAHARQQLPDYMVPSAVVVLDALPQTPTGKLDLKMLPAPDYAGESSESNGDGPRDFLEVQLLHIWEELLGVELIGTTQNFFELGGNSLLALRLFAQIRNRLHCELPVSLLFSHATVRDMADAIRERRDGAEPESMAVIPLQPDGSRPPLFCVHPAGPEVHAYVNIVRHLGSDQPVYGVRDVGNDFTRPLLQVAAGHVAAIRAVQPHGPYFIVGWSFGGNVAYEMAVLLERQGETVAFVGLIDTLATVVGAQSLDVAGAALVVGVAGDFAEQMGWPFAVQTSDIDGMTFDEQLRYVTNALHAGRGGDTSETVAWLRQGCEILRARSISRQGYVPNPYSGTVTLFRASEMREDLNDRFVSRMASWTAEEQRTVGWSRLTAVPVEVHWVPGSHGTVGSEPHVRVLAQHMRESLAAARALVGEHARAS